MTAVKKELRSLFLGIALMLSAGLQAAESIYEEFESLPIKRIVFEGNDDVDDDDLCDELPFGEGDIFTEDLIEKSVEALMDTDDFDSVKPSVTLNDVGLIITFTVDEKWHVMALGKGAPRSKYACKAKIDPNSMKSLEGIPIEEIRFEGNKTTREITLRDEILITEGDDFDVEKLIKSRQSIQNLSLFKRVHVRAEQGPAGVIVTFTVKEKWYILPLPTLSRNADGDISYGAEVTWDNVWGLNHRLKFEIEQENKKDGEKEQKLELDYDIPKIPGTAYGMGFGAERKRTLTESVDEDGKLLGEYYAYTDSLGVSLSRWLKRTAPSQGWQGAVGAVWIRNFAREENGSPVLPGEYRQLNWGVSGVFTAVNDHELYRSGQEYGAVLGVGRERLGSTDDYHNIGIFWRRYQPINVPFWSNVNCQVRAGYNQGQDDVFELGGASTMRGIIDDSQPIGDAFGLVNVNWLIPMKKHPAFRWNLFTDVGNAWPRNDIDLLRWKFTVGAGARWKIRKLVNTTLRVDLGYNPETREYRLYAGTNNMF